MFMTVLAWVAMDANECGWSHMDVNDSLLSANDFERLRLDSNACHDVLGLKLVWMVSSWLRPIDLEPFVFRTPGWTPWVLPWKLFLYTTRDAQPPGTKQSPYLPYSNPCEGTYGPQGRLVKFTTRVGVVACSQLSGSFPLIFLSRRPTTMLARSNDLAMCWLDLHKHQIYLARTIFWFSGWFSNPETPGSRKSTKIRVSPILSLVWDPINPGPTCEIYHYGRVYGLQSAILCISDHLFLAAQRRCLQEAPFLRRGDLLPVLHEGSLRCSFWCRVLLPKKGYEGV